MLDLRWRLLFLCFGFVCVGRLFMVYWLCRWVGFCWLGIWILVVLFVCFVGLWFSGFPVGCLCLRVLFCFVSCLLLFVFADFRFVVMWFA